MFEAAKHIVEDRTHAIWRKKWMTKLKVDETRREVENRLRGKIVESHKRCSRSQRGDCGETITAVETTKVKLIPGVYLGKRRKF